jgi:hypothetical protein
VTSSLEGTVAASTLGSPVGRPVCTSLDEQGLLTKLKLAMPHGEGDLLQAEDMLPGTLHYLQHDYSIAKVNALKLNDIFQ